MSEQTQTEMRRIYMFDTTLRDGEQSPGCTMSLRDKLLVAEHLEALRVDIIEGGFAIASPGDFEAVKSIAGVVKNAAVASLCRALPKDIDRTWEAIRSARHPRIHTFIATSPIHMEFKLNMTPDQVYDQAVAMVRYARNLCGDVEFSLEDCSRSERPFIYRIIEGVIAAGAGTINIPDTVGYAVPEQFGQLIADIRVNVPNVDKARLSVHCHNDLGLAVANSLAAIRAGADQVEGTINGIGERAGNTALEEVVMALHTRREFFQAQTGIDTTKIYATSRCVATVTGSRVQPNKAIVGENAFAHEAGIHQHGVMANPLTYEIMTPESIGLPRNKMVLGKHSGRHAFESRLRELGFPLDAERMQELFVRFKDLADRKKNISDADLEALAQDVQSMVTEHVKLDRFNVTASNAITPVSTIRLLRDGKLVEQVAASDGPINASFKAINQILGLKVTLESFQLTAITGGTDAQCEATVRVRDGDHIYHGRGVSTDVIEGSILAYLQALNSLLDEAAETSKRPA
ncbi:MAG TPA: 2-isopropylmalate synthase [Kiritimatiellia bacterium]|nr:2-isopropylmalate synthase [Kiritimatiellia bacterium]HOR97238.1 2-isopropylmalate synthase [Kiritimatiellia bacterium]